MEKQVIHGICPSKSNSYRIIKIKGISAIGKSSKQKEYEKSFFMQCNLYRNANIDGYFEFYIDAFFPTMRNDIDGVLKGTLDCLQKIKAIKNDNLCIKIVARKFVDKKNPRIEFILKKVHGF